MLKTGIHNILYVKSKDRGSSFLREDYNDLTNPTSNQIPDISIAVSDVYGTFKRLFFEHLCSYCLVLHCYCEMKLSVLFL